MRAPEDLDDVEHGLGEADRAAVASQVSQLLLTDPLGLAPLLGQDPLREIPHPGIPVLEETLKLHPAPARHVEPAAQQALDVAHALPVLELLRGEPRALTAEMAAMAAAGEAFVGPHPLAGPAETPAFLRRHTTSSLRETDPRSTTVRPSCRSRSSRQPPRRREGQAPSP